MDVLRRHLVRSLKSGQAFVSFEKALSKVKPEYINARPNGALHTVYEELEHMRIAQHDLLYYAFDEGWEPRPWPKGFWRAIHGASRAARIMNTSRKLPTMAEGSCV